MQFEAEEIAKRAMPEADNRARVKKMFQIIYGRDATEEEIKLGLEYIKSEPALSYDERKKKEKEVSKADTPAPTEGQVGAPAAAADAPPGMGMMDGLLPAIGGRRSGGAEDKPIVYEPTIWGRYAKVLLSSSEFLFIN